MTKYRFVLLTSLMMGMSSGMFCQQYGWKWQSPLPQGNNLSSVWPLTVNAIVAIGDEGTLLRTIDAGDSWDVRYRLEGIEIRLSSLHFVDSLHGWCVASRSLLTTTDGGATWTRRDVNTSGSISMVFFTDVLHGWIAGHNTLMRTTDGGAVWDTLNFFGLSGFSFSSIYFVNERLGWLGLTGLYRTTDGGETWSPNGPSGPWTWYQSIFFTDSLRGWAGGAGSQFGSLLIRTTDGGTTWTTLPTPSGFVNSILFLDSLRGWVVDGRNYVNTTRDGGTTWDTSAHFASAGLNSIQHTKNSSHLWAVGTDGVIGTSTDEGNTWMQKSSHVASLLHDVDFVSSRIGWAVGGGVFKTTNGGNVWLDQHVSSEMYLRSIFALDSLHAWCASMNPAAVIRTTNGGMEWLTDSVPTPTNQGWYRVFFINERVGWLAGRFGEFRRTTDGGHHWETVPSGTQYDLGGLFFIDSLRGWMVGNGATFLRTTNRGLNWSVSTINQVIPHMLWDVQFISPTVGWVAGESSLLKTTDGGGSWTLLRPNDGITIYRRIRFVDSMRGWMTTNKGIMATTDGGLTWDIQPTPTSTLASIDFVDSQRGWAVSGARILATTTGGSLTYMRPPEEIPVRAMLYQNYPNPFNPRTEIRYQMSEVGHVTLKVFDVLGREVATLVDEVKEAGEHHVTLDAARLSSGVYFYRLQAGDFLAAKKLILLR